MLFNSNFFLYTFLPALLFLYFLSLFLFRGSVRAGNVVILLFSIFFYYCTGGKYLLLLAAVILLNYAAAILLKRFSGAARLWLAAGVTLNIAILFYYKYTGFFLENLEAAGRLLGAEGADWAFEVALPVGISFFIFQAMSYLIDVYRGEVPVQYNPGKFALYISLFPQLIAGPIVRYKTVCREIDRRESRTEDVYEGLCRFAFGLGKKVLIADTLGTCVDQIWGLPYANLTTALAWTGSFFYTLQIYFDFSGYSDMAIGLGRIFGFHFDENFVLPYTAKNMTEFWRRWHISLSSFLRDYLYIPLGGNRRGTLCTYRNLLIVFLVCGLWHGAAWTYVVWGLYHGMFLVAERLLSSKKKFRMEGVLGQGATFLFALIGWVFFRSQSLKDAAKYLLVMAGRQHLSGFQFFEYGYYVYPKLLAVAAAAFCLAVFPFEDIRKKWGDSIWKGAAALCVLVLSMAYLSDASFTPFIYFQF